MLSKEEVGCKESDFGVGINTQWRAYIDEWNAKGPAYWASVGTSGGAARNSYLYWKSKAAVWPELSRVGRWWMAIPLSSIVAERTFALGRVIDVPQRSSMSWDTFIMELSLRVQQGKVAELLTEYAGKW